MADARLQASSDERGQTRDTTTTTTTYDLIVCRDDRIMFHNTFDSPEQRLSGCALLLSEPGVVKSDLGDIVAEQMLALRHARCGQADGQPDAALNTIAKIYRPLGMQIYASTVPRPTRLVADATIRHLSALDTDPKE